MNRSLPGPGPMAPWRVLRALRTDPLAWLTRLVREHGDLVGFSIGPYRTVVISDPDAIAEVLVSKRDAFIKDRVTRQLSEVLGQGLLTAEGEPWKRQRRVAAPSFRPRHLAAYADAMVRSTAERPAEGDEVDVHAWMTEITLAIVERTLFGTEPGDQGARVGALLEGLTGAFEAEQRTMWRFVPGWVPSAHRRLVSEHVAELDAILAEVITGHDPDGDDLLARLLAARDDDGSALTDAEVRDDALTLFLAGHETTSLALSYSLWLLAEHPELLARAHDEVDRVLGDRDATMADVRALAFVDAVVKEGMRLMPPAWAFGREVVQPVRIGGYALPVGTQVVISQWVMHRDPRHWVGPERFRPDRWLNGETADLPKFVYLPFGGGARVCIGNHFAQMEAVLVLATVLQRHGLATVPGYAPDLLPAVTLRPRRGVQLAVRPRRAGEQHEAA